MNDAASLLRTASQWITGALLVIVLMGLFVAIAAVQVTSQGTGQRLLRRAVAVTTELDAILPEIESDLKAAAKESDDQQVRVPDFPIPVDLPRQEALELQGAELRGRLLDEAAHRLYEDGWSAWAKADPEADQRIETVSTAGAVHRGLGLVTDDNHTRFVIASAVLGFLAVAVAAMLVFSLHSYSRISALGAAVMIAAFPLLAAAIAIRFAFRTAEEEADPFVSGLFSLGVDAMWVPLRDYLALTSLGFATIAVGMFALWWQARRTAAQPPALDSGASG